MLSEHGSSRNSNSAQPLSAPNSRLSRSLSPVEKNHGCQSDVSSQDLSERQFGNDIGGVGSSNGSHSSQQNPGASTLASGPHPRYMLPRASGMSTMGEIHSLAPPHAQSSAALASNPSGYDQSSVYPATWHEYEDQFNYFYNCHFIEQDYYDYLSGNLRRPGDNDSNPSTDQSSDSADESVYGESSFSTSDDEVCALDRGATSAVLSVENREEPTT
ncbi:hypothetical protein H4S08_001628 [Coemansia sp. RSA 1365]|nr:hypothetical protein H4S08_001628 [Coemansia sp. RSA 1365]